MLALHLFHWMPLLGAVLASHGIQQANRNVNTLLYPRALNWSGNGQLGSGFGLIWLSMNGNPSKVCCQSFSEFIYFHDFFFPFPHLTEGSWCNVGGGRAGARRHDVFPDLFSIFFGECLVFLECFGLYHSQHQQALVLFELSRCSSNANKT